MDYLCPKCGRGKELCDPMFYPIELDNAIRNHDIDRLKCLIADSRIEPLVMNTAFCSAVKKGDLVCVELLLADPRVNPASYSNSAITVAAKEGYLDIVERLLADPRVNPSTDYNSAISLAIRGRHIDIAERLLADPRVDPCDSLCWASGVSTGPAIVRLLLKNPRTDPSAKDNVALRTAIGLGNIEIVELLLTDPRIDPSADNNFAMEVARRYRQQYIIDILFEDYRVYSSFKGHGKYAKRYKAKKQNSIFKEELMAVTWHPDRFMEWCVDLEEKRECGM